MCIFCKVKNGELSIKIFFEKFEYHKFVDVFSKSKNLIYKCSLYIF